MYVCSETCASKAFQGGMKKSGECCGLPDFYKDGLVSTILTQY